MAIIDFIENGKRVIEEIKSLSLVRISEFENLSIKKLNNLIDNYQEQIETGLSPNGTPLSILELQIVDIKLNEALQVVQQKLDDEGVKIKLV